MRGKKKQELREPKIGNSWHQTGKILIAHINIQKMWKNNDFPRKKKTIAGFSTSMLVVFSLDEGNGKTEIVGNLNGKNKEATIKTGK